MEISLELLSKRDACQNQLELFAVTFGSNPVTVTPELCLEHADKFDWVWAAQEFLSEETMKQFLAQRADWSREYRLKCRGIKYRSSNEPMVSCIEETRTMITELTKVYNRRLAELFGQLAQAQETPTKR